jgi:2-dehydro-3-deoxygalactonokinase
MLLALDWGTTSFRAYLFDSKRTLVETRSAAAGIMQDNDGFEQVYYRQVGDWLGQHRSIPVIASGMITSNQGWVETPYLPCPASLEDLSKNLTRHETSKDDVIFFVSGVCQNTPTPNIMRGEETQMAGLRGCSERTAVLPGTHSKWIRMEGDTICYFSTFMTGEIFAVLTRHTILGRLLTDGSDPKGFTKGVEDGFSGLDSAGGIMSKLFGARAMPLLGQMNPDSIRDYISGLLLGTEIQEAVKSGFGSNVVPVICGSPDLVDRYQTAMSICGIQTSRGEDELAALGLMRIAAAAGLV